MVVPVGREKLSWKRKGQLFRPRFPKAPHLYSAEFWDFNQVAVGGASWWRNKYNLTPDFPRKGESLLNSNLG